VLEKRGERDLACECYRLAARPRPATTVSQLLSRRCAGEANLRLSLLLKRGDRLIEAEGIWQEMMKRRQMGILPYEEMAKRLEHGYRDYEQALRLTERALKMTQDDKERARLTLRRERLIRKMDKTTNMEEQ